MFSKRGAYRKFRALLIRRNVLDRWYDFELKATERALRDWCEFNSIAVTDRLREPGYREHAFAPRVDGSCGAPFPRLRSGCLFRSRTGSPRLTRGLFFCNSFRLPGRPLAHRLSLGSWESLRD